MNSKEVRLERARCLKNAMTTLSLEGKFSRYDFWKVRRSIYQKFESCSSVIDATGHEVFDDVLIRRAYEEEFKLRLSHRTINPMLSDYQDKTNILASLYVEEA